LALLGERVKGFGDGGVVAVESPKVMGEARNADGIKPGKIWDEDLGVRTANLRNLIHPKVG